MTLFKRLKNKISPLIYKLQRYVKIDLFYLIKGESWLMAGKVVSMGTSFLLSLVWANWVDKNIYGNYQYILSLFGIISIFSLPEMGSAVVQAVARNLEGSFIHGFKVQLKWGLLGSLTALGIAGYYWLQGNNNFTLCFIIIALFLPLFQAAQIYTAFLEGRKLFDVNVKYTSVIQVISAGLMIFTLFCINYFFPGLPVLLTLFIIICAYFLPRTILHIYFLLRTKIKFKPNNEEDPKTIGFAKHLTLAAILGILADNLDKVFLFHYLGAVEVAVFSFAVAVPDQIVVILKHISALSLPKFSIRSREEIRKTLLRKIYFLTAIISTVVLIYIIFAPLAYQIFFPKYLNSVSYSRLYALSIIPLCFSMGTIFRAKMIIKPIYIIRIIVPLFKIALCIILIPLYGIWGTVLVIIITRIFGAFLSLYFFRQI